MEKLVLFFLLGLLALASAFPALEDLHHGEPVFYKRTDHEGQQYYAGVYKGVCYFDGIYYGSESEVIFCTNGRAVSQQCGYGTRNNDLNNYIYGHYYGYDDFCNVNLVDSEFVAAYTRV